MRLGSLPAAWGRTGGKLETETKRSAELTGCWETWDGAATSQQPGCSKNCIFFSEGVKDGLFSVA